MSEWPDKNQWSGGGQHAGSTTPYGNTNAPYPGPTPGYAPAYQPQQQPFVQDVKDPYEGDRFKPKKRVNDPIFLVLFILQVCIYLAIVQLLQLELSGSSLDLL